MRRMFLASPILISQRSFETTGTIHYEFHPIFTFLERHHANQICFFLLLEIYFHHLVPQEYKFSSYFPQGLRPPSTTNHNRISTKHKSNIPRVHNTQQTSTCIKKPPKCFQSLKTPISAQDAMPKASLVPVALAATILAL